MSANIGRKRGRHFDWVLFGIVLVLAAVGLLNYYSACVAEGDPDAIVQQIRWLVLGIGVAIVVGISDYRYAERLAPVFYVGALVLLLAILIPGLGIARNDSRRWIQMPGFEMQPSELMKIGIILVTARYFHHREALEGRGLKDLLLPAVLFFVPAALIADQPDLGTALAIGLILLTMVIFDGLKRILYIAGGVSAVLAIPLMWAFVLADYHKDRIRALFSPAQYADTTGYQVLQANIAIGSGGTLGKGYLHGTQVQNGYVPYHMNDFVFVHHAEQFGFVGTILLVAMYFALVVWSLQIARVARDRFAVLTAVGIAAFFFWHVFINIGMVTGILPVIGLWLPFASEGGTAMLTVFTCIGLLFSISSRRHAF